MIKALALALTLFVAACGTIPNPVTKDRLTTIKEGYGIVLTGAVAYRDACAKRLIASTCRIYVPRLVRADEGVKLAFRRLNDLVALGNTLSYPQAIDAVSDAVNDFKLIASEAGVK